MTTTIGHFDCCAVPIAALDLPQAVDALLELATDGRGHDVHLCNAYSLTLATKDERHNDILNRSALNLADGAPVAWVGRHQGPPRGRGPVRGPRLMAELLERTTDGNATHFFFGTNEHTLTRLQTAISATYPGVMVLGYEPAPYRELNDAEIDALVEKLEQLDPDFIWISLGTPKQDALIARLAGRRRGVFVGIGAAFDFASGTKREAPSWLHGTGLEWVFRFACEPRRLFWRYLIGNTRFIRRIMPALR
jgi:N-acetylglucosaminyldiphosphoundecaprenol N-acetyl-beta-D-mannosaminyltransferase